jgi:hypothetical protein
MPRFLILSWAVSFLCVGCGKTSPSATAPAATNAGTSAVAPGSEADLANTLAELTQALRKFSVEKRQVPASLNELVAAGYIKSLPQPPPGKAFAIDSNPKNLQVIVK